LLISWSLPSNGSTCHNMLVQTHLKYVTEYNSSESAFQGSYFLRDLFSGEWTQPRYANWFTPHLSSLTSVDHFSFDITNKIHSSSSFQEMRTE
jgi:hypothetical protein